MSIDVINVPDSKAADATNSEPEKVSAHETIAVIVTYNASKWITPCLDSFAGDGCKRVIVVDNASGDDTLEQIAARPEANVTVEVIRLDQNVGFGQANNLGIQRALDAGAEFVALFNQDLTLEPLAVSRMVGALREHPDLAIVSALQLSYSGDAIDDTFHNHLPSGFWDDVVLRKARDIYEVKIVPAAAIILRRSALLEVGGFDPLFFMYGEDFDLCDRMQARGWSYAIVPAARVRHWHTAIQTQSYARGDINRFKSVAIRYLKSSPRPVPIAAVGLSWRWFRPHIRFGVPISNRFGAKLKAIAQCLPLMGEIARHRASIPFRFEDRRSEANLASNGHQSGNGSSGGR